MFVLGKHGFFRWHSKLLKQNLFIKEIIDQINILSSVYILWTENLSISKSFKYNYWVGGLEGQWLVGWWVGE